MSAPVPNHTSVSIEQKFINLLNEGPISYSMFRGKDFMIEMANDEALRLWGKDKSIIGKKLSEAIPELVGQPYLGIIEEVYNTGSTYEGKEHLAYLRKNGILTPVYINFMYKLVKSAQDEEHSILCIGYDVTEQVTSRKTLAEAEERSRLVIESSSLGTFDLNFQTGERLFSQKFREIMGLTQPQIGIRQITSAIHPDDLQVIRRARTEGREKGSFNCEARILLRDNSIRGVNAQARMIFDAAGNPVRLIGMLKDITPKLAQEQALIESERKFRNTVYQAPAGIAILRGPSFRFEMANAAYLSFIEKSEEEVMNRDLFDCLPEVRPVVEPLLRNVMETGIPYHHPELEVILKRSGRQDNAFFNLVYQPMLEPDGSVGGIIVVTNEVTGQVNSRHMLSQSEKQFRKVVMESPIAMTILKGPDLIIEMANKAMFQNIWRRKEENVVGRKLLEVFPELEHQQFPELLRKVMRSKEIYRDNEAMAYVHGDDGMRQFYLDFEYAPLLDTNDNVSGITITVYDVTQKVKLRQQIMESADRLQLATEGTRLATWDLDLVTRAVFHSPKLAEIFGHDKGVMLTHPQMLDQIHPEDRYNILEKAFERAMETGSYNYEARIIRPDKSICWVKTSGKVYYDGDNRPLRMLGTLMDVTEQRLKDEHVSQLAAIVQSTSDAIISVDLDRIITNWNDSAERIFGYKEEEILGKPITTLIPRELWYQEDEIFEKILANQHIENLQTIRKHKSGAPIDISLSISPIKDRQGNIVSISKIARDISKQKQIERLISDNEERLKIIVEASELGTWELGMAEPYLDYSPRYLAIFGHPETARPSHEALQAQIHPDDVTIRTQAYEQAYHSGLLNYSCRIFWSDGSIHWVEIKGKTLYDEAGKALKVIGTVRDITAEKKRQQKIEESELRLRTAALSSELGTWDYNPKTETLRWDDASKKLFGVGVDAEVSMELFFDRMHPEDRSAALDKMLQALNPNVATNYEAEYRIFGLPGDELRWVQTKGKAFFDEEKKPYHFSGTVLDITEKRLALEELKDSERKFRLLADSMPQLIWTSDVQGELNYFNRSAYEYCGMNQGMLNRQEWLQLVHPGERDEFTKTWDESLNSGKAFHTEHRFRRHDGEYRWKLSLAIPQRDEAGNIQMWVGTSTDIHDQKTFAKDLEQKVQERTKDLQQANQELARMNEELASFAYVSSHDLQEPLRKIQTFANRISEKEQLSDTGRDYFRRMQDAAQRMNLLIEDLLAYSRTSTTEKVFELTDLNRLLEEVKHDLEQSIREKQATIEISELPSLNIIPFQFRQLFTNILSNALKFSKQDLPSQIRISADQVKGSDMAYGELDKDKLYWHITVRDNGIGFAPEYNHRIFEVFQRLHGKHEYKGTGIGLAICKKIMENHHGGIFAVGEPDVGATFHLYIPA